MDRRQNLQEAIKFAESKIKNAPEGTLYVKKIGDDFRYYQKTAKQKKETYLSAKDSNTIERLQEKVFQKLNGERVRSKSELIIADRLKTAGVPYYYEGRYVFEDDDLNSKKGAFDSEYDVWFPDFQVLNTRTGELLFWEHFGLMDNPEYCASAQFKIETYSKHGFILGKNLIMTTESSQHSLNVEYVDRLIKEFLLNG